MTSTLGQASLRTQRRKAQGVRGDQRCDLFSFQHDHLHHDCVSRSCVQRLSFLRCGYQVFDAEKLMAAGRVCGFLYDDAMVNFMMIYHAVIFLMILIIEILVMIRTGPIIEIIIIILIIIMAFRRIPT